MTTQHETFGGTLRRIRKLRGLTQSQLAAAPSVEAAYGRPLTSAAVSEWERDQNLPKNRATVQALDDELAADGELLRAGGYNGPPGTDTEERLSAIEAEMKMLRRDMKRLLAQRRRAADS